MEVRHILSYLGVFLYIAGFISLLPAAVAHYYSEPAAPFIVSGGLMIVAGYGLAQLPRKSLSFGESMILSAVSLIILSLFGSITYYMTLSGPPAEVLVDGFFESVSGITTTGFTILSNERLDPQSPLYMHSMVFNRSLRQWLGGLGIIVLALSILAGGGISTVYLYQVGEEMERITPTVEHTARIVTRIYLFYTLAGVILLWIFGMTFFNSVNAALSSISTGGFAYSSRGLHASGPAVSVMMLIMLAGAVPFTIHYNLLRGNVKQFFSNIETKTLLALIAVVTLVVFMLYLKMMGLPEALYSAVFNTVSVVTTTGYSLNPITQWNASSDGVKIAYTLLMIVGGSAGSTAGGLKIIRLAILFKGLRWMIRRAMMPKTAVLPLKVGRHVFRMEELATVALYFALYIMLLSFSAVIYMGYGINLDGGSIPAVDSIFLSASALSNASPTTVHITQQPLIVKATLILEMMLGRLEIFPLIALLAYAIHTTKKQNK